MINVLGFILLALFKDSMNQVLWWILMSVDVLLTALGTAAMLVKIWILEKEKAEEKEYLESLIRIHLK